MIALVKKIEMQEDAYTSIAFAIFEGGLEVGACSIMMDDAYAYCERIDIYDGLQGRGYGTEALHELSRMYGGIVVAPDNADAKKLYERLGSEWSGEDAPYIDQGYGVYEI